MHRIYSKLKNIKECNFISYGTSILKDIDMYIGQDDVARFNSLPFGASIDGDGIVCSNEFHLDEWRL